MPRSKDSDRASKLPRTGIVPPLAKSFSWINMADRSADANLPSYAHVIVTRQELSVAEAERLVEYFSTVLSEHGGNVVDHEYWGVKNMAFKINKSRRGHYAFLRSDAPLAAVTEMERLARLHEDVMRVMTIKVDHGQEINASIEEVSFPASSVTMHRGKRRHRSAWEDIDARIDAPDPDSSHYRRDIVPTDDDDIESALNSAIVKALSELGTKAKKARTLVDDANLHVSSVIDEIRARQAKK